MVSKSRPTAAPKSSSSNRPSWLKLAAPEQSGAASLCGPARRWRASLRVALCPAADRIRRNRPSTPFARGRSRDVDGTSGQQRHPSSKMYKETTRSITITVVPTYLDDQSSPEESHYVWKYHVRIEN